jgi:hypothetical protein
MKRISLYSIAVAIGLTIGGYVASCAHTTPGQFKDAVVTCTMENSHNPQASSAVLNCLTNAVAGNYAACLAGLPQLGHWTVDEIACVVRRLATESAQRINAGKAEPTDQQVLDDANQWLRDQGIKFRAAP